jgi:beta-1,2-mannobiose phosphorylase / 1,2-beta-oligomannan phosphorylase
MYIVKKSQHNPIFSHKRENYFEAHAAFNMSVLKIKNKIIGVYRAESSKDVTREPERISSIGISESKDGMDFTKRRLLIEASESFDIKGCEDPRITFFEGKYYIFYTSLSGYPFNKDNIKVSVAISSDLKKIESKHLVTPFNAKAFSLFPNRVNGKVVALLSVNTDKDKKDLRMSIAMADNIEDFFDNKFWDKWITQLDRYSLDLHRDEYDFFEGGAVPVLTKRGWLIIYCHVQNYYDGSGHDKIFGIEALLLDKNDPLKIIGRSRGPIIVPSEDYEILGRVENVIFPSGAYLQDETLYVYYGVVDTKTCLAEINCEDLLNTIDYKTADKFKFERVFDKPILSPNALHDWESLATFNPGAAYIDGKVYILYRAMSKDNTSTIGLAISKNGYDIDERLTEPIYVPRMDFESKKVPNGNSGCEDPRAVVIDKHLYMFYTAYNGVDLPRVAVTKILLKDFVNRKFNWEEPFLISPEGYDDKDTCVFPEKIGDEYFVMHRIGIDICGDYIDTLDFEFENLDKCISIMEPRLNCWDAHKVGIATPPIKTEHGWLVLYHGISKSNKTYRVGCALLDLHDPSYLISRIQDPIFQPELSFEKVGIVNNVVFPCGAAVIGKYIYIYYGASDSVTGVAKMELKKLIQALIR